MNELFLLGNSQSKYCDTTICHPCQTPGTFAVRICRQFSRWAGYPTPRLFWPLQSHQSENKMQKKNENKCNIIKHLLRANWILSHMGPPKSAKRSLILVVE